MTPDEARQLSDAQLRAEIDRMIVEGGGSDDDEDRQERFGVLVEERRRRHEEGGGLRVDERAEGTGRGTGLAETFRARGFPGETAEITFDEWAANERAATWTGAVADLDPDRRPPGVALGFDRRYAWPAFTQVPVDAGTTSVTIPRQASRTLASAANVVRAIDAVTQKPETSSVLELVETALNQVASVQTGVRNLFLEQPAFNSVIEQDLRLAVNEGLDKLVLDKIATAGFTAPGTDPPTIYIRKAMTTLLNAGYNPDLVIVTPAVSEALDLAVSGITGGTQDFVYQPGQFAPNIWSLTRRVSKTIPAPAVVDSRAFGKLYSSPITLARFEENAGGTNTSTVRLEGNAVFGLERVAAATRCAAS
jgi:hypothetical protein